MDDESIDEHDLGDWDEDRSADDRTVLERRWCCPECFAHPWLKERASLLARHRGRCDFSLDEAVPLLRPAKLSTYLLNLVHRYRTCGHKAFDAVPDDLLPEWEWLIGPTPGDWDACGHQPLVSLIQDDFLVFNPALPDALKAHLLNAILQLAPSSLSKRAMSLCLRDPRSPSPLTAEWTDFCRAVRSDPGAQMPRYSYLTDLKGLNASFVGGSLVYRARIGFRVGHNDRRFPYRSSAIGAPPTGKARAARANREGQRVLYCALDEHTAVAECRPAKGMYVSVARFRLEKGLLAANVSAFTASDNPFLDNSWRSGLYAAFAEEMARPLERGDDITTYRPCQRLAELLQSRGYGAIRYPSALHESGTNVVLFDLENVAFVDSTLIRVSQTDLEYERVGPQVRGGPKRLRRAWLILARKFRLGRT